RRMVSTSGSSGMVLFGVHFVIGNFGLVGLGHGGGIGNFGVGNVGVGFAVVLDGRSGQAGAGRQVLPRHLGRGLLGLLLGPALAPAHRGTTTRHDGLEPLGVVGAFGDVVVAAPFVERPG